jgi:uncharacterized paraquat-inducible protein A
MNRTKSLTAACSECGGPVECPAERIGTMMQCPRCGKQAALLLAAPEQEASVPRKVVVWTVVAVLVLLLGLGGSLVALKRAQNWAERQKEKAKAAQPGR